jgi:hypothetical protein
MARLARIAFLATLLLAAGALAACGDDSTEHSRYVDQLTAAHNAYTKTDRMLNAAITPTSTPRQDRRTLDRLTAAIDVAIARLRRIDVPPEVTSEHRRYVGVFETWHGDVEDVVAAIDAPTPSGIKRADRRFAAASRRFNKSVIDAGAAIDHKLAG